MTAPDAMDAGRALTDAEAELYDRQIRLWGVDAQRRMRQASVLLCGAGALTAEVAKNIVLSGVEHVTLLDDGATTVEDLAAQFHIQESDVGVNRATASLDRIRVLNPNVVVSADTDALATKTGDYFKQFSIVCVTRTYDQQLLIKVNAFCREHGVRFYCGDVFGMNGFFFADLGKTHQYVKESTPKEGEDTVVSNHTASFVPLADAFRTTYEAGAKDNWKRTMRTIPHILFHIRAIYHFHDEHQRQPGPGDDAAFAQSLAAVCTASRISEAVVDKDGTLAAAVCHVVGAEFMPVAAIVGGVLAQEMLKAVSGKDAPLQNTFIFNGDAGVVVNLRPTA